MNDWLVIDGKNEKPNIAQEVLQGESDDGTTKHLDIDVSFIRFLESSVARC